MRTTPADIAVSLESLASGEHCRLDGMLKIEADLDRYRQIIEATKPEVLVETGTLTGASAMWFASLGVQVITVDVSPRAIPSGNVISVVGSSIDPLTVNTVLAWLQGRRCMVSLDSDHSAPHVKAEIGLYGPMVSEGCYLVVEDTIFGYASPELCAKQGFSLEHGSPLDAVEELLEGKPGWVRDLAIEGAYPATHHPNGFWRHEG